MSGELLRELQDLGARARPTAKKILEGFGPRIVLRAKEIAPDDPDGETPDLRHSIRFVTRMSRGGVRLSVIAGGAELDAKLRAEHRKVPGAHEVYAFVQHEDPTIRHTRGQSNFIGAPFMATVPLIAEAFDKELTSARG